PNQFVNMRLRVQTVQGATIIPEATVQRASFGTFVYVVKPDNTVTIRRIDLGPAQGERVSIAKGLTVAEQVVLEGVDDLTEGAKVEVIPEGGVAPRRNAEGAGAPGAGGERGAGGGRRGGAAGGGRPRKTLPPFFIPPSRAPLRWARWGLVA